MSQITQIAEVRGQCQSTDRLSVKPPFYVWLGLMVFVVTAAILIGQVFQLRLTAQPSNPFTAYEAILPGQPRSAVIELKFSCDPASGAGGYVYCTGAPGNGLFSLISVTLSDDIVYRANFTVAEDQLTAGDLASLWGEPVVQLYGTSANFAWPNKGVNARGQAVNGKFSYFIQVHHISLRLQPLE